MNQKKRPFSEIGFCPVAKGMFCKLSKSTWKKCRPIKKKKKHISFESYQGAKIAAQSKE